MVTRPVTAAPEPRRIPKGHEGGGRFAKPGDVGALIVKALRNAGDHGVPLPLRRDAPDALHHQFGPTPHVHHHSDTHAAVMVDGRRVLVPIRHFDQPTGPQTVQDMAGERTPVPTGQQVYNSGLDHLPVGTTVSTSMRAQTGDHWVVTDNGLRHVASGPDSPVRPSRELGGNAKWYVLGQPGETPGNMDLARTRFQVDGWESTKPWNVTADDIRAGRGPEWLTFGQGRGTEEASTSGDMIHVTPSYFTRSEGVRRAILWHEFGHSLDEQTGFHGDRSQDAAVALMHGGVDSPAWVPSGGGPSEMVAEGYSRLHTDPQWMADHEPELTAWLIAKADEHGYPVPDEARTVQPRSFTHRNGDTVTLADIPVGARFDDATGHTYTRTADGATTDRGTHVTTGYLSGAETSTGRPVTPAAAPTFTLRTDLPTVQDMAAPVRDAVDRLVARQHESGDLNVPDLPTLPSVRAGERYRDQPMPPAAQQHALAVLAASPVGAITVRDVANGEPLTRVAVNPETGEIVAAHNPETALVPPYGRWVTVDATDPDAVPLVTAAWTANPATRQHMAAVATHLRHGDPVEADGVPGLIDTLVAESDQLAAPYRGDQHRMRLVNDRDGAWYTPDDHGDVTVHGDGIRYADFAADGTLRLWVDPDATVTAPLPQIDWSTVDDATLPWADRVKAARKVRSQVVAALGPDHTDWFRVPTDTEAWQAVNGHGSEPDLERIALVERFGATVGDLVDERARSVVTPSEKQAVLAQLADVPIPDGLRRLLETEDWGLVERNPTVGWTSVRFAGYDSGVTVATPLDGTSPAVVAWEISGAQQHHLNIQGFEPSGALHVDQTLLAPDVHQPTRPDPTVDSPTMAAWLDTMEALGVDMGVDDKVVIGTTDTPDPRFPYARTDNERYLHVGDITETSELGRTVAAGLRPFPRSWTTALRARMTRVDIIADRAEPTGANATYHDASIMKVPSIDAHPDYKDVISHEFTHVMEHTIAGLITAETWHFIRRLRDEKARTGRNAQWSWGPGAAGWRDEFGTEYLGRLYGPLTDQNPGYEILATASQMLHGHADRSRVNLDPESRHLLMGLMATITPPVPDTVW